VQPVSFSSYVASTERMPTPTWSGSLWKGVNGLSELMFSNPYSGSKFRLRGRIAEEVPFTFGDKVTHFVSWAGMAMFAQKTSWKWAALGVGFLCFTKLVERPRKIGVCDRRPRNEAFFKKLIEDFPPPTSRAALPRQIEQMFARCKEEHSRTRVFSDQLIYQFSRFLYPGIATEIDKNLSIVESPEISAQVHRNLALTSALNGLPGEERLVSWTGSGRWVKDETLSSLALIKKDAETAGKIFNEELRAETLLVIGTPGAIREIGQLGEEGENLSLALQAIERSRGDWEGAIATAKRIPSLVCRGAALYKLGERGEVANILNQLKNQCEESRYPSSGYFQLLFSHNPEQGWKELGQYPDWESRSIILNALWVGGIVRNEEEFQRAIDAQVAQVMEEIERIDADENSPHTTRHNITLCHLAQVQSYLNVAHGKRLAASIPNTCYHNCALLGISTLELGRGVPEAIDTAKQIFNSDRFQKKAKLEMRREMARNEPLSSFGLLHSEPISKAEMLEQYLDLLFEYGRESRVLPPKIERFPLWAYEYDSGAEPFPQFRSSWELFDGGKPNLERFAFQWRPLTIEDHAFPRAVWRILTYVGGRERLETKGHRKRARPAS